LISSQGLWRRFNEKKFLVGVAGILLLVSLWSRGQSLPAEPAKNEYSEMREMPTMAMIQGNSLLPITGIISEKVEGIVTAYNPVWWQTDSTPHITASGSQAREGIIANNCLEFGTLVEIEGKVYAVEDRMNQKYGCNYFDILMFDLEEAKEFGKRNLLVMVYK